MPTVELARFAEGAVRVECDYSAGNRRVTAVRCVNNGTGNLRATLLNPDNSIAHQTTFLSGTTQLNVAGQQVTLDAEGYPQMPYIVRLDYPVP